PALRAGAEAVARDALRGEIAARPWMALLEQARAAGAHAGEEVERALDAQLGYAITKDHARMRREAADRGKRAARRAQTAALDRGLALVGLWLRDIGCVVAGAPELVHHSDRAEALREDAALGPSAAQLHAGQELVERARTTLQLNPNEELALDALGSRLARALA
ncbi:MAG: hypothetical protein M3401_04225, partial [Actinomycetota bacterium]|nr:hypothetical protein [Actinomycetota bacterium]